MEERRIYFDVKPLHWDHGSILTLRKNGIAYSTNACAAKADVLNKHFAATFAHDTDTS